MSRSYDIPRYEATKRTTRHGWLISGGYTDGLALPPELPQLVADAIAAFVTAEVEAALSEPRRGVQVGSHNVQHNTFAVNKLH